MTSAPNQLFFLNPQRKTPCLKEMPLFIFLPGMDGTGELLYLQTEDLQHSFDLRCLVIPSSDTSSWEQLADGVGLCAVTLPGFGDVPRAVRCERSASSGREVAHSAARASLTP